MNRVFMGITFGRLGYSPENIEHMNSPGYGKKPDKRTVKQLIAAYNQPLPSLDDITAFEERFVFKLPQDYIRFLSEVNGGKPNKSYLAKFELGVRHFFALGCPYPYDAVDKKLEMSDPQDRWVEQKVIAIAENGGGDRYMMRVHPDKANDIYFDQHDAYYEDEYFDVEKAQRIAGSFTELLSLLEEG